MAPPPMANDIFVAQRADKMSSEYTYFLFVLELQVSVQSFKVFDKDWSKVSGSRFGLGDGAKSFGILRVAKIKAMANMAASLQHTFRERETPNADSHRLQDNTVLLGADNSAGVIVAWHDRAPEKIRSNAVHGLEYFVGGSPARLNAMSRDEQDAYFDDALDWIKRERGAENVLSAVVHRDETTPHMTVMTIPLDENERLNARAIVGNKGKLSQMQTDFADQVSERHGLVRGVKGSTARHERVKRVYGEHLQLDNPVILPKREKGSLLSGRGESDQDWLVRATLTATDAVQASTLAQKEALQDAQNKLGAALDVMAHLKELTFVAKTRADEANRELARLKNGLEIAGSGQVANEAVARYDALASRIEAGDLALIKEATKDPEMMRAVFEVYEATTPAGTKLTDDQLRFDGALTSAIDAMATAGKYPTRDLDRIAVATPALPCCEKTIAYIRENSMGSPFTNKADVLAFRAEVETALSADALDALWSGEVDCVSALFNEPVTNLEGMRFALVYLDNAGVPSQNSVRLDLIERIGDVRSEEQKEQLVDRETGLRH